MKIQPTTMGQIYDGLKSYEKSTDDEVLADLLKTAADQIEIAAKYLPSMYDLLKECEITEDGSQENADWIEARDIVLDGVGQHLEF